MSVTLDKPVAFGGRISDIRNQSFECIVTTAKDGLFRGLSTMIFTPPRNPRARILYGTAISKETRQELHSVISREIDAEGSKGRNLEEAISLAFGTLQAQQTQCELEWVL